jgi:hypothetical protein
MGNCCDGGSSTDVSKQPPSAAPAPAPAPTSAAGAADAKSHGSARALTLEEVLAWPEGRAALLTFTQAELSDKNLRFTSAVAEWVAAVRTASAAYAGPPHDPPLDRHTVALAGAAPCAELRAAAAQLIRTYLMVGAPYEVTVTREVKLEVAERLHLALDHATCAPNGDAAGFNPLMATINIDAFEPARGVVVASLKFDQFPRFVKSKFYADAMAAKK